MKHFRRRQSHSATTAIRDIMAHRKMKSGDVMRELGFKPLDASLGMALSRGTQLQPDLIKGLERWLTVKGVS